MEVLRPASLADAAALVRERSDALPVAGGTVVAALLNKGRIAPAALIDLSRLEDLRGWSDDGESIRLGAALTYADLGSPSLARRCPALALAAAAVGSVQIRNRGTLGGCLGAGGGDAVAALLVERAEVELPFERRVPLEQVLRERPQELVVALHVRPVERERFTKLGRRNAFSPTLLSAAFAVEGAEVRAAATGPGVEPTLVSGGADTIADELAACASTAYARHALHVLTARALAS
jgi:CO/xanthine dehydrogenase FAD-binding subunit